MIALSGSAPGVSCHEKNQMARPSGAHIASRGPSGATLETALRSLSGTSPSVAARVPSAPHSSTVRGNSGIGKPSGTGSARRSTIRRDSSGAISQLKIIAGAPTGWSAPPSTVTLVICEVAYATKRA